MSRKGVLSAEVGGREDTMAFAAVAAGRVRPYAPCMYDSRQPTDGMAWRDKPHA